MATWYFKPSSDSNFETLGNWWSNVNGTGSNPSVIPWTTSATAGDNLQYATGSSGDAILSLHGTKLGNGFSITGTCYVNIKRNGSNFNNDGSIIRIRTISFYVYITSTCY